MKISKILLMKSITTPRGDGTSLMGIDAITGIIYKPIGIIHSEHIAAEQTPVQPVYAQGCEGRAEIFKKHGRSHDKKSVSGLLS